jgi:hypothetical protein
MIVNFGNFAPQLPKEDTSFLYGSLDDSSEIGELYQDWTTTTERGQKSSSGYTPPFELPDVSTLPPKPEVAPPSPEMMERLNNLDPTILEGLRKSGGNFINVSPSGVSDRVGMFSRQNQYDNITQYNPLGTAPEDYIEYADLNSPEALAAKASREQEVAAKMEEWTTPLKELSKSDPAKFTQEYSSLPLNAQLAYLKSEKNKGRLSDKEYKEAFAQQWNASGQPGTLQYIDKYGWRMYAPDVVKQQGGQDPTGPHTWYETEGLFDSSADRLGSWTPRVKETFDPTSFGRGLLASAPLRLAAGVMTGGLSEGAIAAGKGVTGDTLHAGDWLSIASTGLQLADVITPPASEAAAAEAGQQAMQAADAAGLSNAAAMQAGNAAQATALAGKGLTIGNKALTYNQSVGLLNAAAGNPTGAAIQLYGGDLINEGLDKVGLDQATIENAGIQYDDFQAGIGKVVSEVAGGAELDNALASGLGTYIREGGTLGSIDLPETNIDLGVIEDVVRDVVRPIGKIGTEIAKFVEDGAQAIGDATRPIIKAIEKPLKPIGDVIEDVGQVTGDVVEDVGQVTGDVVEDVAQVTGDIVEDVAQVTGDIVEDVAQATGDVLSDLDTAIRQSLPDIDLPDVDLPSIDLPSIDLPFELRPTLVSDTGQDFIPSATRTTDALFGGELFKFKTPIEGTQERLDYIDLNSPFDQSQELELELTYPGSTEESDGFFEGTIYEQQPRSYNF